MSLCSRRVAHSSCKSATVKTNHENNVETEKIECPQSRTDFHKTLSILIRMGCGDKSVQDRGTRRHVSIICIKCWFFVLCIIDVIIFVDK